MRASNGIVGVVVAILLSSHFAFLSSSTQFLGKDITGCTPLPHHPPSPQHTETITYEQHLITKSTAFYQE
jgi:hypothetical protein